MSDAVRISAGGSLGRITLARPERRNPLDDEMAQGIVDGLRRHFADDAIRSVVIDAEGDAFCAGADLDQLKSLPELTTDQAFAWPAAIVEAQLMMVDAPKPVMAAVQGPAYAGGMGLAAMCDIVLASRRASFATPEVKIGLFPMIIVPQLVRALPRKMLLELMFTGDPMSAEDAHRHGFVNTLADDSDGLDGLVDHFADRLAKASPVAVRMGRRAFSVLSDATVSDGLRAAQLFNVPFFLGQDFAEGATAFLEKRPAGWIGEAE